jgi:hypothetical protein
LDQGGLAEPRPGAGSAQALGSSQEAATPAATGNDAVSEPAPAKAGDGSTHAWLAGQPALDLVVTLDDATSEIYSAFLVEEEGTGSSFLGLHEVIAAKGLFSSLYTDRSSHYFLTPEAGGGVDRLHPTQVGRALAELKIEHIASYSPEGRGRMERVFGTLQQRLPPLLRLHGITTMAAANRYLAQTYLPEHNAALRGRCDRSGERLRTLCRRSR